MRRPRSSPGAMRVATAFDADPSQTSYELADRLGLEPVYVRRVLQKCGRKLMRKRGEKK